MTVSTTNFAKAGPKLGRTVLQGGGAGDGLAEVTTDGELKVIQSGTSTTSGATNVTITGVAGNQGVVSSTGSIDVQPVTYNGNPIHPLRTTNAWIESTTAGSFVLATTVASNFINIIGMKAECTAAASFILRSGIASTISPSMAIAASVTEDWNLTNINGAPWFRSAAAGDAIEIVVPSYAGNSDNALKVFIVTTNTTV